MGGIAIDPPNWVGGLVVLADVAHELALEVWHRGEDTSGDHVALDLGEPELDLIEPGRVGGGEVQVDIAVLCKELADLLGLVGCQVVGDHVDLLAPALVGHDVAEEGDELCRGGAPRRLSQDLAGSWC